MVKSVNSRCVIARNKAAALIVEDSADLGARFRSSRYSADSLQECSRKRALCKKIDEYTVATAGRVTSFHH
jgi:hypothetical protein